MNLAFGLTLIFGAMALFFVAGRGFSGGQSPLYVAASGVAAALAWWWAIRTIRARTAAGKTVEQLQALTPDQFEEWVAARFRGLGYSVKVTGLSGDHGVDLVVEKPGETGVVQCKNYKAWSVGEPVLRDLYGAMHDFKAAKAYLVTTGRLTAAAANWLNGKPIEVWDGERLAAMSSQVAPKLAAAAGTPPGPQVGTVGVDCPVPAAVEAKTTGPVCPQCGSALVERRNRRSGEAFLACPRYPKCRHTQPLRPATI